MVAHARQFRTNSGTNAVATQNDPASGARARYLRPDAAMLSAALEAAGTSQRQLAERLHLSRARVGQWLAGEASLSVERIEAIASACPTLGRELARRAVARLERLTEAPLAPIGLERGLRRCTAELGDVARAVDEGAPEHELRREVREFVDAVDVLRGVVG